MKTIQTLSKQIAKLQTELDRADAAKARCLAAIEAAKVRAAELRSLQEQRTRIVAQAFADGGKPDTAAIDAEIAAYAEAHGQEMSDGEAASSALDLLETRCTEYRDALTNARAELTEEALSDLRARRLQAKEAYSRAVDTLREPLEAYLAIDSAEIRLSGNYRNAAYTPGRMLLEALRSEGLRVWTERGLAGPEWMGSLGKSGKAEALLEELRAAGLEV